MLKIFSGHPGFGFRPESSGAAQAEALRAQEATCRLPHPVHVALLRSRPEVMFRRHVATVPGGARPRHDKRATFDFFVSFTLIFFW